MAEEHDRAEWYRLELRVQVDPKKLPDREDVSEAFIDLFDAIPASKRRAAGFLDSTTPDARPLL